jgi:predicted transcriptional regulator
MKCEETDVRILQIAEKLRELRTKKYSSYEDFAFSNNIPRVSYFRLEKGCNFKIQTLIKILDIHEMTLAEFFSDID